MAEPKKRLTSTRSGNRKSHDALKHQCLSNCPKCSDPVPSHRVCPTCGTYKGEKIIDVEKKSKKE